MFTIYLFANSNKTSCKARVIIIVVVVIIITLMTSVMSFGLSVRPSARPWVCISTSPTTGIFVT